jgi:hypothetical protein
MYQYFFTLGKAGGLFSMDLRIGRHFIEKVEKLKASS